MNVLMQKPISEISAALRTGRISSEELTRSYLEEIRDKNASLNAYLEIFDDALEQAEAADAKIADGSLVSPLAGIPIAVKDNILIRGRRTTAGSKILENYVASYDAAVISKLRAAGAVFLGKTNMDEFAMGSSTENSAFGPTKNPHDPSRVPGGTSGGSAAAVAGEMCAVALGSDTGGSIRQPASFCGVVGLKPTYGSVSRSGLIATVSSMDQVGTLARNVGDARALFDTIRGHDPMDATSVNQQNQESRIKNQRIRIGVPTEYFGEGLDEDVESVIRDTIQKCEDLGFEAKDISLPNARHALAAYYIINFAESSTNLARFDGIRYGHSTPNAETLLEVYEKSRAEGFGSEPKRRIILGTFTLSHGYYDAYYRKAQQVRRLIKQDFENAFKDVDFIVGPTSPTPAFKLGEKTADPLQMYLADIYTVAINLAGVPAISMPAGWVERDSARLPVGFQITGRRFEEDVLFDFAGALEGALNFQKT